MGFSSRASVKKQVSLARVIPPPASVIASPTGASLVLQGGIPTIGGAAAYPAGAQLVIQGGVPVPGAAYAAPTGASLVLSGGTPVVVTSPLALSGLVAWWDASSIGLADGTAVDTWADSSGNGFTLTGTLTARPVYKTNIKNGLPVVRFDGSNDVMTNTSFSDFADNYTVFCVMALSASAGSPNGVFEVSKGTANTGFLLFGASGAGNTVDWEAVDNGARTATSGIDDRNGTFRVWTCITNHGGSPSCAIRQNGVQKGTATYANTNANLLNRIDVGERPGAIQPFKGDIGELFMFSRSLTDAEVGYMETYAMSRWALP